MPSNGYALDGMAWVLGTTSFKNEGWNDDVDMEIGG